MPATFIAKGMKMGVGTGAAGPSQGVVLLPLTGAGQ